MKKLLTEAYTKGREVLTHPSEFYKKESKKEGLKAAFIYYLLLTLFSIILSIVFVYLIYPLLFQIAPQAFPQVEQQVTISQVLVYLIGSFVVAQIAGFVYAGILHLWIRLFKGKKAYAVTYKMYVYSRTPVVLFGWLPYLSPVAWVYSVYLMIVGTECLFGFSKRKAFIVYALPLALLVLIAIYSGTRTI